MANPVVCNAKVVCRSDVKRIWSVLSDTDRLNFAVGMDTLELTPLRSTSAARFIAKTKLEGIRVSFEEQPYEWIYPERFSVQRKMLSGPLRSLELVCELQPRGSGCEVSLTVILQPRFVLLRVLASRGGRRSVAALAEEVGRIDDAIQRGEDYPAARRRPMINEGALKAGLATLTLSDSPPALVDKLIKLLRQGDDLQVAALRPFELADAWKAERVAVLNLLFRAAEVGLLETRWQIICPSCRVPSQTFPKLEDVGQHAACQYCDIDFQVNLDESVELVFVASPQTRSTVEGIFCIGGPARTPHVLVQSIVPARGSVLLLVPRQPASYRLFVRGGAECTVEAAPNQPLRMRAQCDTLSRTVPLAVAPGGLIELFNGSDNAMHAKIEDSAWASRAASAGDVMRLTLTKQPLAMPP